MAVERTLVLIKPDAVARGLAGEILARFEARGLALRGGRLLTVSRELARGALRRAQGEAVLRRARRVHHLVADAGAGARGRRGDRGRPLDDGRRRIRPTRRRGRSAAISRFRCRTTSCTVPTRPSRPRARSRCGSPTMSSSDALRNRAAWDRLSDGVPGAAPRVHRAAGAALGDVAAAGVGARGAGRRRGEGRARARVRRRTVVDPARRGRARGSSDWTTRSGSSSTRGR